MSVPCKKISKDKQGFIKRVIDRFGGDPINHPFNKTLLVFAYFFAALVVK